MVTVYSLVQNSTLVQSLQKMAEDKETSTSTGSSTSICERVLPVLVPGIWGDERKIHDDFSRQNESTRVAIMLAPPLIIELLFLSCS
jgi:hypothetical protein